MRLTRAAADAQSATLLCEGPITQSLAAPVNPFEEVLGPECYALRVLLDVSKTLSIDSSGVSWLIRSHQRFQEKGGRLVIYDIPPLVQQVLSLMRMQKVLHLAQDETAARALLISDLSSTAGVKAS